MNDSDPALIANMAYCLTWEIAGARANQYWQGIRQYIESNEGLSEIESWTCELYEESSPTAQEERSIVSRINARINHPSQVPTFRKATLGLLPEFMMEIAEKHRLMQSLAVPRGYSRIRTWLADHKMASPRSVDSGGASLAVREADFQRFIETPYFIEGFRKFWHRPPKYRDNRQTRVLLLLAAALSQVVACQNIDELEQWSHRLGQMDNFTEQTRQDITFLTEAMLNESYDAHELAFWLFVDATEADRQRLVAFCERYTNEMTVFARELVRGLRIDS